MKPFSILAGALLCAAPLQAQNLIKNGDFETESPSVPTGWAMWGQPQWKNPTNYTRDTTQAHSGAASFRITRPTGTAGYIAADPATNTIEPQKGATYEFSFWAKADAPRKATFQVQALSSLQPLVSANLPLSREIDVTTEWQKYTFTLSESYDFFADTQRRLFLTFSAATGAAADTDKTLWVDDVSAVVVPRPADVPTLLNFETVPYTPVNHRLQPGNALVVNLDAAHIVRPSTKATTGVSFHSVNGYMNLPYNSEGQYKLTAEQEEAIRALRPHHTRFFRLGDQNNSLNDAIDGAANTLNRTGIPQEGTVLEFEDQNSRRNLTPQKWSEGIKYSLGKGYNFHHWEVSNEPFSVTGRALYTSPQVYVDHVKAVSPAIRAADPKGLVGVAIDMTGNDWGNQILGKVAGQYDFVSSHWYSFIDPSKNPFEMVVTGDNYRLFDRISRTNALLKAYNPNRDVYQYDTEWGLHALTDGKEATSVVYNGNIVGALHRAVRLIYYTREDLLRGASAWEMFAHPSRWNDLALLPATGDKKSMLYWTHRTFNEHLGDSVVEMTGTAPFYTPTTANDVRRGAPLPGPLTPAIATLSKDGKTLYFTIVNGSWDKASPLTLNLANFNAKSATGVQLSNDDVNRSGLLDKKEDFVNDFPVTLNGNTLKANIPPHAAIFLTFTR